MSNHHSCLKALAHRQNRYPCLISAQFGVQQQHHSFPVAPAAQEETFVHELMWADRSNHTQGSERDSKGRMEKSKSLGKKHPCCSCSFTDIVYFKFSLIILNWMIMLSFFSSTSITPVSNYLVKFMLNNFNSWFPLPDLCTIYPTNADFFILVVSFH